MNGMTYFKENFPNINLLLDNLFGQKKNLAIDYLHVLIKHPGQWLPVLVLSGEQESGKTTFLDLVKRISNGEAVITDIYRLVSRFNEKWAGKSIVMVDDFSIYRDCFEIFHEIAAHRLIQREKKGELPELVQNDTRLIISSNQHDDLINLHRYADLPERYFWYVTDGKHISDIDHQFCGRVLSEADEFSKFLCDTYHLGNAVEIIEEGGAR